jgi:hypothetical protein
MTSPILKLPAIEGEVVVWGDDTAHQITGAPKTGVFTKVAPGGATQILAIDANGRPELWGGFGVGSPAMPIVPALTSIAGEKYVDVAIGVSFAAAIRMSDGWIQTWGPLAVPAGVNNDSTLPKSLAGKTFTAVTVGGAFGVGIDGQGALHQWGVGEDTQPQPRGIKFVEVRARNDYCVARDSLHNLFAWGTDPLFRPPTPEGSVPVTREAHPLTGTDWEFVSSGQYWFHKGPFMAIAAGSLQKTLAPHPFPHVLALKPDGSVVGWGANTYGAITNVPAGVKFSAIAAGNAYSVGLDRAGMLHHWGFPGASLSLGGPGILADVPIGPFVSIGAGTRQAVAIRPSRHVAPTAIG